MSRFREELGHGYDTRTAVVRTVRTAGRTVIFSAVTVAISLAAMLVFPITFLKSFAYAGIAVAVMAAVGAVVVLPALLAVLGPRVNKWALFHRTATPAVGQGVWHRIATAVMKRPLPIATAAIVFLLALGSPFLHIAFGLPDDRVLPPGDSARVVQDALRNDFTSREASPLEVVMTGIDPSRSGGEIAAYAAALSQVPGVARVDAATGSYAGGQPGGAGRPGLGPVRRPRRHLAVGRAVGRADVGRGRGRRPRRAGGAGPGAGPRRRPVGRAGRLEGLRCSPASRWPPASSW